MTKLEQLGEHVAREQDELRARSNARAEVRARLAALELVPARKHNALPYFAAVALACAAAFLAWPRASDPAALVMHIGASQEPVRAGTWVEAPENKGDLRLSFSDGTHIDMAPRARLRVIELSPRGAHLMLESGRARVAVVPRSGAAWRLSAGPFSVRVIGTRFDVGWDPDADAFELDLAKGEVELSGCVFGRQYRMLTGHTVAASCRNGQLNVKRRGAHAAAPKATEPVAAPPVAAPIELVEEPTPSADARPIRPHVTRSRPGAARTRARARAPIESASAADWRALAQEGKYAEAFASARISGFALECERADAEGLALLAQAARHVGQTDGEADALLLLRSRYAGTARAALAAFALGRLEFDKRHAHAKAAQWFGTYLKEQPQGTLAREARGRLMEATLAAGDRARARELAASYLRDHPSGPHAQLARSLAGDTGSSR
jgi:hypothetical protein